MMHLPINKDTSRGFTLVELLVAMTIMAMIAGLLSNSMRFGLRTADAVESKMSEIESFHQSQRAFRRQVQLAQPIPRLDGESGDELDFVAKAEQLEFIAPLPGLATGGGLYRISLQIEDDPRLDGSDGRLMMRYRMYLDGSDDKARDIPEGEVVLLQGFSNAQFSFGDTLRPNNGQWANEWRQRERLPDIVRLSINFGGNPDNEALDLIVAIKAPLPVRLGAS
jgi:prepilin-type N-terminal cleavage/methylation domain-containing protein